jgi:hypothetical protein
VSRDVNPGDAPASQPGGGVEIVGPSDSTHGKAERNAVEPPKARRCIRRKIREPVELPTTPRSQQQLDLAYEACQKTLASQDTTLGNVRTRANTLLSTSALFVSFSAGIGLINTDPHKGTVLSAPKALALLFVVLALGLCVLFVLWPIDGWIFSVSARKLMQRSNTDTRAALQTYVLEEVVQGIEDNRVALDTKQRGLRCAAMLLLVEILLLVIFLTQ